MSDGQGARPGRIEIIDALRGLAVVLMVIHHFLYDLCEFLGAPWWLFTNPVFDVLHYIFAGTFIFLAGVSSRFSRSNVKRGIKVLIAAAAVTAVTYFMGMPIYFGILQLLGTCMLLYGLTHKLWEKFSGWWFPALCAALTAFSAWAVARVPAGVNVFTWILGWNPQAYYSADYFPLLPWVFVFLCGTWAGRPIKEGALPQWFYDLRVKFLPAVGRHAFIIYLAHQPVLYGITLLIGKLTGKM